MRYLESNKKMPRLPPEIREIVWQYIHAFNMILSLPKKKAVRKLIRKSNIDILHRFLEIQVDLNGGTVNINPFLFRTSVLTNPIQLSILTDCTITSLRFFPATGILKWLFLEQDLYLYSDYFELLKTSVLFDVITNVDFDLVSIL